MDNYVTQRWKDNDISKHNLTPITKWKNIPDVVLSVYTSILQRLVPTQVYRRQGFDLICTICQSTEETVPHLLRGYSAIAQTIFKARYDRMLRPIFHLLLSVHNIENDDSKAIPEGSTEHDEARILWDTPIYRKKAPENGANIPDMTIFHLKNKVIILVEGTVCNIGQINDRNDYKKRMYLGLWKRYSDYEIKQTNMVLNSLGDFNSTLKKEVSSLERNKDLTKVLTNRQKLCHRTVNSPKKFTV